MSYNTVSVEFSFFAHQSASALDDLREVASALPVYVKPSDTISPPTYYSRELSPFEFDDSSDSSSGYPSPPQRASELLVNPADRSTWRQFRKTVDHVLNEPIRRRSGSYFSDNESDADDANDEDYRPERDAESSRGNKRQRRNAASRAYRVPEVVQTRRAVAKAPSTKAPRKKYPGKKTPRAQPQSRNVRADSATSAFIRAKLRCTKLTNTDWRCPACDYVQSNHRMPDYKRHIETHLPHKHQCTMCDTGFSRTDAMKRHFLNAHLNKAKK